VSIGSKSKRGRKKDEAEQTICVALATLVQLSNGHFKYLNSLRAGNICLHCSAKWPAVAGCYLTKLTFVQSRCNWTTKEPANF